MVHSIQSLQASVRGDDNPAVVRSHLDAIGAIVGKMVSETQNTMERTSNQELRERITPTMLANSRTKILEASSKCESIHDLQTWSKFKDTLPPLAFDVARETKELVQRLDQLGGAA